MRRAAHPSGCARCGAGAGCSAVQYQSLLRRGGDLLVADDGEVVEFGMVELVHLPGVFGVDGLGVFRVEGLGEVGCG